MNRKRLYFYASRCTGCRLCEAICALRHTGTSSREPGRLRVLTDEKLMLHRVLFCHHCRRPVCAELCPLNAIHRDEATSTVRVNAERCIGCRECLACPLGGMFMDESAGVAALCDYCGGEPACVRFCPFEALAFADASRQAMMPAGAAHSSTSQPEVEAK